MGCPDLSSESTADRADKRVFPRIPAQCPVRFRVDQTRRWLIARLVDFSATGLLMLAPCPILAGNPVSIHLEPGSRRDIPPLAGDGKVVRCVDLGNGEYQVAVKILKFAPLQKQPA